MLSKRKKKSKNNFSFFKKSLGSNSTDSVSTPATTSAPAAAAAPASSVFGKPLPNHASLLPYFVQEAYQVILNKGFNTEGIFRLAASKLVLDTIYEKLEKGERVDLHKYDEHAAAALLKRYFRDLPDPLLTFECYDMFLAAEAIPDTETRIEMIKKVISFVPGVNLEVLRNLCLFLCKIRDNNAVNKMTSGNLAIVFAPNLLRSRLALTPQEMYKDSKHSNDLMTTLIEEAEYLFLDGKRQRDKELDKQRQEEQKRNEKLLSIFNTDVLAEPVTPPASSSAPAPIVTPTPAPVTVHAPPAPTPAAEVTPALSDNSDYEDADIVMADSALAAVPTSVETYEDSPTPTAVEPAPPAPVVPAPAPVEPNTEQPAPELSATAEPSEHAPTPAEQTPPAEASPVVTNPNASASIQRRASLIKLPGMPAGENQLANEMRRAVLSKRYQKSQTLDYEAMVAQNKFTVAPVSPVSPSPTTFESSPAPTAPPAVPSVPTVQTITEGVKSVSISPSNSFTTTRGVVEPTQPSSTPPATSTSSQASSPPEEEAVGKKRPRTKFGILSKFAAAFKAPKKQKTYKW